MSRFKYEESERDTALRERIELLEKQSYQGYTISGNRAKWNGFELFAKNRSGRPLSTSGETLEEAFS